MQLVKDGPDIPERLLEEHEEGRVVFFCGAGISYPANLPGFQGLVDKIFIRTKATKSTIEDAAYKSSLFDTAIGLLESRIAGGRFAVRRHLPNILKSNAKTPNAVRTHEALLTLSKSRAGSYRLITTNFDRLFERVRLEQKLKLTSYSAPLLPVPKNRWDGLVYLHGLLTEKPNESDLNCLVMSSGDFGLAYLTERWAARFVSELFRNYTVCFVGYSVNDPVMRYMMDALAADQLLGEKPAEVFAFGSFKRGSEVAAADDWRAKNVTPILYLESKGHDNLHQSLHAWSELYRDNVLGKENIVSRYATTKPVGSTLQDDYIGRVVWALSDTSGLPAKRFATFDPTPSIDWLEPLENKRFKRDDLRRFGVQPTSKQKDDIQFSLLSRPSPFTHAPWMSTVYGKVDNDPRWDNVMKWMAHWLSKHVGDPRLLIWISSNGGKLHPALEVILTEQVSNLSLKHPLMPVWRIALMGKLKHLTDVSDLYSWQEKFKRNGLTRSLLAQFREYLSPRVALREVFSMEEETGVTSEPTTLRELLDWNVVLRADYVREALADLNGNLQWKENLHLLLPTVIDLLHDTLDMMRELDGANQYTDYSFMHHPSIDDHPQNRYNKEWTVLIDLVRDAWLNTAEKFPDRARSEVYRWNEIDYPIFRRLTLFAATKTELFSIQETINWLLVDDARWLWSIETRRETIRLLVKIAPSLNVRKAAPLVTAILRGPPVRGDASEADRNEAFKERQIWLLLSKFRAAGGILGAKASLRLMQIAQKFPQWKLAENEKDEFSFWMGDGDEFMSFRATPSDTEELKTWLRKHRETDDWQEDDWRERCKSDFAVAVAALVSLAVEGDWIIDRWTEALQAWSIKEFSNLSWRAVGDILLNAPDEAFQSLVRPISFWLQVVAQDFDEGENIFFALLNKVLEEHRREEFVDAEDILGRAINHPIGHSTDAALVFWFRSKLEDGQKIKTEFSRIFTRVSDTRTKIFRYGRILLGRNVIALFRVDPNWTERRVLPLFSWSKDPQEARIVWIGFLWSPRLYQPLLSKLKQPFLDCADHYNELGDIKEQYAALLTYAYLQHIQVFSKAEYAAATLKLPVDGLQHVTRTLVSALEGAGDQKFDYWRNRVKPYLREIWPKSRGANTPEIAKNFARLCAIAGAAFPQVLEEVRPWLQKSADNGTVVFALHEDSLPKRFPSPALDFLDSITSDDTNWVPSKLRNCLDMIVSSKPKLVNDQKYVRLDTLIRRIRP